MLAVGGGASSHLLPQQRRLSNWNTSSISLGPQRPSGPAEGGTVEARRSARAGGPRCPRPRTVTMVVPGTSRQALRQRCVAGRLVAAVVVALRHRRVGTDHAAATPVVQLAARVRAAALLRLHAEVTGAALVDAPAATPAGSAVLAAHRAARPPRAPAAVVARDAREVRHVRAAQRSRVEANPLWRRVEGNRLRARHEQQRREQRVHGARHAQPVACAAGCTRGRHAKASRRPCCVPTRRARKAAADAHAQQPGTAQTPSIRREGTRMRSPPSGVVRSGALSRLVRLRCAPRCCGMQALAPAPAAARSCRRGSRRVTAVTASIKSTRKDAQAGNKCAAASARLLAACADAAAPRYRETFQVSLLGLGGKATEQILTGGPNTTLVPLLIARPLGIVFEERKVALNAPPVCVADEVAPGRCAAAAQRLSAAATDLACAATRRRRASASATCSACAPPWWSTATRRTPSLTTQARPRHATGERCSLQTRSRSRR